MRSLGSIGVWALAGGLALAAGSVARCQAGSGSGDGQGSGRGSGQGSGSGSGLRVSQTGEQQVAPAAPVEDRTMTKMEADQAKMRNTGRQKQLVEDTQKLLSLANELKADVDKSTKDTMSVDVIRKADEIERLAHNVKEKMKGNN